MSCKKIGMQELNKNHYLVAFLVHDGQEFEGISDHLIARKDITVNDHFCEGKFGVGICS